MVVASVSFAATPAAHAASNVVTDGHARFEVLTPTLIRLEYAGDDRFQDQSSFTALNRNLPVPAFTTDVAGGFREIHTAGVTLRYRQGSGPFTAANTSVQLAGTAVTGAPAFPSYCAFGAACQAENGLLGGTASTAYDHQGYSGSGFAAGFTSAGSSVTQEVSAVPAAGSYRLAVRYANAAGGDGQTTTRTLATTVDGVTGPTLTLPATGSWDTWATASAAINLGAGTHTVRIAQDRGASGNVNLDSVAVTPAGAAYPGADETLLSTGYGAGPKNVLGGWDRSLDNPETVPTPEHPGLLDRDGWYLLDDTRTPLLNPDKTITDRPAHGGQPYEDGYLFGYGQDYKRGLGDLNALSGGAAMLPQSAYGVWFSRYYAYTAADYRNSLLPAFRSSFTPIDWLVVDTDWKSPSQWNGWNWNPALFPDPQGFLDWTKQQGLSVSLNIHPSIAGDDPKFATANAQAGGLLSSGGNDHSWDWTNPAHLKSYLDLHQPFEQQGVREWWLDYCTGCGASRAGDPHVAADNFINQAYAEDARARGLRGFSFARIGGAEQGGIHSSYPSGPWSERRNTLQFTGDTPAGWDMLGFEARFTPDESAAGLVNVSHDIGSFHGGHLPDDLYARWVQLGTFQPVDRLHSDHGDRLPWNYTGDAAASAEKFLRLRESLVPYTYTLARQANTTGVPLTHPLYLDYPAQEDAYTHPQEYLYGDNVLVAPITSAAGSVSAWIPPGTWTDYFTGASYTGPSTTTLSAPLTSMPVLVKSGGIVPTRTDYTQDQHQPLTQLTLSVGAGADGNFSLYQDSGEGTGPSATTPIRWNDAGRTLTVGAAAGTYPGAPSARAYTLRLSNTVAPTAVSVDGGRLPETAWAYNSDARTVTVNTASLPVGSAHTVTLTGSAAGNPSSGEVLGSGGRCLAVRGGTSADGQPIETAPCDHSAGQLVTPPAAGAVRVLGKCLDAANAGTAAGTTVQLYTCNGTGAQSWALQANGTLVNPASGRCLAVPDGGAARLDDCSTAPTQSWRFPPAPISGPGGQCADVAGADPSSPAPVQLWGCNTSDAQRWSAPGDGTLRAFGKCLDVAHGDTANDTPVQLWDCNGSGAQTWVTRADGSLLNPSSARCLDDPDNAGTPGDRLRIHDCNQTAAQRFTLGR
ncbi:ricin-type beta-trefoil lectin domain protein [Amycolatopsis sp. PS_44_ISF1]|uniref:ricin-type beta-trefoil lectin domain protein n=1 Tax=Amycolatopsis sp. PS_44_ISF1 TaxID=2974917 RepID=UPI0028E08862|nr:ricin-type beta-trefoil lectin domain protein [Amycolatopsis sp. PS_44_ISF1]MDT8915974.1 ricin-type beta-trefoil lectin domain protein [Amycolatopsis sp. PS_44_ISF1]